MLTRLWQTPRFCFGMSNGVLEDFFVVAEPDGSYRAWFVHGPTFQDMRLWTALGTTPEGPFGEVRPAPDGGARHTRLARGRLDDTRRLVTAVWPGLPHAGLFCFDDRGPLTVKTLLHGTKPGTAYSVVLGNPGVLVDPPGWALCCEGRTEHVFWRLVQGHIAPDLTVTMDDAPIADGANPSFLRVGSRVYLYYSRPESGGFATWVMHQDDP